MMNTRTALLVGAAFLSSPAFAQDAQTVTPPPIMVSPQPVQPAPAAPAPATVMEIAPQAPIVQPAPPPGPRAEDVAAAEAATARTARRAPAPQRQARATAPAAPASAPAPAPASAAPAPAPAEPTAATGSVGTPPVEAAPVETAPAAPTVTETTQTARSSGIAWPILLGGILLVLAGAAALLLLRRRRVDEPEVVEDRIREDRVYEAPVAAQPVYVPEPVAAAPIAPAFVAPAMIEETSVEAHSEAELAQPDRDELVGVADAPAPVANRPWLEFGLRPVRAGTSEDEAVVDVELTVGNAGDQAARDVRISTFMLADADDGEMERLLTGHRSDAAVPPVTIAPGDGTRVDAHLAVPKGELGHTFNPVVVAEARYTLPDGREGRTSAAFKIGRSAPDLAGVGAIGASRPHLVEDVEAELLGVPEHA